MMKKNLSNNLTVLAYHRITDDNKDNYTSVSTRNFRIQMESLKKHSYNTVSLKEAYELIKEGKPLPQKSVLITFDDGYRDNFTNAYPILKKYNFKATIFLTTEKIQNNPEYLSWEQVESMAGDSIDFGSHTLNHPNLCAESNDGVKRELTESKIKLEQKLQRPVDFFCYPFGCFNESTKAIAKQVGYKAAFSVIPGRTKVGDDAYEIKRIQIGNRDSLFDFKNKITGLYHPIQKYRYSQNVQKLIKKMTAKSARINVLYIIWSLGLGGAERVVINLARGLEKQKFNPIVCCLNEKGEFSEELESEGIAVVELKKRGKFDISVIGKLINIIKRNNVRVVHTHLWGANFWGRIAAKLAGVPVVVSTEHNVDYWKNFVHFVIDKILSASTDTVIAVSDTVRDFYRKRAKISTRKIRTIYNGIEVNKQTGSMVPACRQAWNGQLSTDHRLSTTELKKELGIKDSEIVLATIGRLVPQKGHRYLFDALLKLDSTQKIKLLVIGNGPHKNILRLTACGLGLDDRVIFTGLRKDVRNILNIVDLVILSSTREGLPIIALEAMAASVPVVATDVGGNKEIIVNNQTGLLVPPKNPQALAEAISLCIKNKDLREKFSYSARRRIEEYFSLKKMVRETQEIYSELLIEKCGN